MKLFLTDSELRNRGGLEPQATLGQLKAAIGIVALATVVLVGHEVAESIQHHQQCETVLNNPNASISAINDCY